MLERARWLCTSRGRPQRSGLAWLLRTNRLSWPRATGTFARNIGQRPAIPRRQRASISSGPQRCHWASRGTNCRSARRGGGRPRYRRLFAWSRCSWSKRRGHGGRGGSRRANGCRRRHRCRRLRGGRASCRRRSRRLGSNFRTRRSSGRSRDRVNGRGHRFGCGRDSWAGSSRLCHAWSSRAGLRGRRAGWLHTGGLRGSFLRFFLRFGCSFGLSFGFCDPLNFLSYVFRNVGRNRTGVRLLLGDAETRQKINDRFGLDL